MGSLRLPEFYQIQLPFSSPPFDLSFALQRLTPCFELLGVEDSYGPMRPCITASLALAVKQKPLLPIIRGADIDAFVFAEEKIDEPHILSIEQKRPEEGAFVCLVAGPGIAPGPRGYEPRDVLLVHPADRL